eukprot:4495694-Prymnesium_polylepis.1
MCRAARSNQPWSAQLSRVSDGEAQDGAAARHQRSAQRRWCSGAGWCGVVGWWGVRVVGWSGGRVVGWWGCGV